LVGMNGRLSALSWGMREVCECEMEDEEFGGGYVDEVRREGKQVASWVSMFFAAVQGDVDWSWSLP